MNTEPLEVRHNDELIGFVYSVPSPFSPDVYVGIQVGTDNITEFYMSRHLAKLALLEKRWSIETRRSRKEEQHDHD